MPQEFLRDVLRTGDASNRARRRLSVLPISIAAHAVAATAFVMSPFVTAIEMPAIASPLRDVMPVIDATPPPAPPPPRTEAPPVADPTRAPTEAPDGVEPERERPPRSDSEGVIGSISIGVDNANTGLLTTSSIGEKPAPPVVPPAPAGPVRVGGQIREPRKVVHVPPIYPDMARISRREGTVILEALLDATGKVERVRVLRSAALLDDAAVTAVRQWRYTPTLLNGVPVPVLMTITVVFSLER